MNLSLKIIAVLIDYDERRAVFTEAAVGLVVKGSFFQNELHEASCTIHVGRLGEHSTDEPELFSIFDLFFRLLLVA